MYRRRHPEKDDLTPEDFQAQLYPIQEEQVRSMPLVSTMIMQNLAKMKLFAVSNLATLQEDLRQTVQHLD